MSNKAGPVAVTLPASMWEYLQEDEVPAWVLKSIKSAAVHALAEAPDCTCKRQFGCRCRCDHCGGTDLQWKAWGSYLDKDLDCQVCGHTQSTWDC